MAVVILGGLLSSMALNLLVLPTFALRSSRASRPPGWITGGATTRTSGISATKPTAIRSRDYRSMAAAIQICNASGQPAGNNRSCARELRNSVWETLSIPHIIYIGLTMRMWHVANTLRNAEVDPHAPAPTAHPSSASGAASLHLWALGLLAGPFYRLYESLLLRQVRRLPIPRHVGIILDGNRRYGEQYGMQNPYDIYSFGALKLEEVLDWCVEVHIPAVTLWVFSTDNLDRPANQVSGILAAIETKLRALARDPLIQQRRVRVQAIGRIEILPGSVVTAIRAACEATAAHNGLVLTIAVAYGGRDEIVDAVRGLLADQAERGVSIVDAIREITRESIARHLYTAGSPDPDLIIRTSGEIRLSGFLLWQSAYSELYFCDVPWPAFRKIDFLRAVRSYQQRKRRFGK